MPTFSILHASLKKKKKGIYYRILTALKFGLPSLRSSSEACALNSLQNVRTHSPLLSDSVEQAEPGQKR